MKKEKINEKNKKLFIFIFFIIFIEIIFFTHFLKSEFMAIIVATISIYMYFVILRKKKIIKDERINSRRVFSEDERIFSREEAIRDFVYQKQNLLDNDKEILGLYSNKKYSIKEIKKSYKKMSKKYHPDISLLDKKESNKRMRILNESYKRLKERLKRVEKI